MARAESPKDYSLGQRPGSPIPYSDDALQEQKMKPTLGNIGYNRFHLLPLQGVIVLSILLPRALPWASIFWAFSPNYLA